MKIIKPKKLQKGDTIGILSISGKIKEYERIENAKLFLENEGYNVIVSDTCKTSHRYQAGISDEDCVNSLHSFFLNKDIDAILCARGGYGTLRLLNQLDFSIVKNNPKIFAGYSDITVLLNMIYKKTGLITFHSPMANGDFGREINENTKRHFFDCLKGNLLEIKAENSTIYNSGIVEGVLFGGNLSSLASLCGIDFVPKENIILFLEELNEPVYKIDKMLTQLLNVETFKNKVKGIALGEFQDVQEENLLKELFFELANRLAIPICDGFKITHAKEKITLPVGVSAFLDSSQGLIKIKEKYIK